MPAIENHSAVTDYMPFIISDGVTHLNLNDQGLLSRIENADDQYTFIQDPEYLNLIKQNNVEIAGVKLKITDDVWDFKEKAPDTVQEKTTYSFSFRPIALCSDYYQTVVKLFVLDNLIRFGVNRPLVYTHFLYARDFAKFLYSQKIYSMDDCNTYLLQKYMSEEKGYVQNNTSQLIKVALKSFLLFYSRISAIDFPDDMYDFLDNINIQGVHAERIAGKYDILPQPFMKRLVELLTKTMDDSSKSIQTRVYAGIVLICTQTGIRPHECAIIPYDCLEIEVIDGISYTEFHYQSTKDVKGAGTMQKRTFANEATVKAVKTVQSLVRSKYLGNINSRELVDFLKDFVIFHAEELQCISDEPLDEFNARPFKATINGKEKYINIPAMKQFRVYLSSELRRRGYNDFAIASLLGHKDEKMLGYYSRPIAKSEEDKLYRDMFLRDVIEDDLKIIGPRGDEYTARINKFMESHKELDVRSSLREITEDIDGLMPMKVIPGGFCICPAPKMSCEAMNKDNADSIYCAYGLCSNQSHLYFDMPFHLSQLRNCEEAVLYNTTNEYVQEAEKELYKAQFICKSLLKPEMDELKDLLNRKGSDYVIQKHPEMKPIIDSLADTEKEITTWEKATI